MLPTSLPLTTKILKRVVKFDLKTVSSRNNWKIKVKYICRGYKSVASHKIFRKLYLNFFSITKSDNSAPHQFRSSRIFNHWAIIKKSRFSSSEKKVNFPI